jgi:hypothetical protein
MRNIESEIKNHQLFSIVSTLIVIGLIAIAEIVLIGENAAFLKAQGKGPKTALALATCVALLIPVIPGLLLEDNRWWVKLGKWIFVGSLITMQVYFASQTAIAPQLKKMVSNSDIVLLEDYRAQLKKYDHQIEAYQKHIDAFPESYRTKRAELSRNQIKLIEDRRKVLSDLKTITRDTNTGPENLVGFFHHLTILATVFYRLALEIGVVIMVCSLRKQFTQLESPAVRTTPLLSETNRIQNLADNQNVSKSTLTPKKFVLSIYPQAFCKSKNGRKGPYVIYSNRLSETEIAKAKSNAGAWQMAAQKLKKGTVSKKKSKNSTLGHPKFYAVNS